MISSYIQIILQLITDLEQSQAEAIQRAAVVVADAIAQGKLIYTFGSGHSQLIAREVAYRAGGLASIVHLPDSSWGLNERVEGVGKSIFAQFPVKAGDVIFVISNSGRNPEPIEVALAAKQKNLSVIAITSLQHSKSVTSRHSSHKKLFEIADIVLDNCAPPGDATMQLDAFPEKIGPVSTALSIILIQAIIVAAIQLLVDRGFVPPVLISANLDGSDQHNQEILERYPQLSWVNQYSV